MPTEPCQGDYGLRFARRQLEIHVVAVPEYEATVTPRDERNGVGLQKPATPDLVDHDIADAVHHVAIQQEPAQRTIFRVRVPVTGHLSPVFPDLNRETLPVRCRIEPGVVSSVRPGRISKKSKPGISVT